MNPILLPLLAGGAILWFVSKGVAGGNIKIYFKGLKTTGNALAPKFYLTFRMVNVTSFPVTVNAVAGEVYVNNKFVGDVNNVETFTVPKTSEIDYSVKFEPNSIQAIQAIYQFIILRKSMEVKFKGTINTSGALIPIEEKIKVI